MRDIRVYHEAQNRARNTVSLPTGSKICPGCKAEKDLAEYHKQLSALDGRQTRCKTCSLLYREANKRRINERSSNWYAANRERRLTSGKQWYEDNKEYRLGKIAEYRAANPEKARAVIKAWRLRNKDHYQA